MYQGKMADPDWRRERALKAAAARTSVATLLKHVARRLPDFTEEQAAELLSMAAGRLFTPITVHGTVKHSSVDLPLGEREELQLRAEDTWIE